MEKDKRKLFRSSSFSQIISSNLIKVDWSNGFELGWNQSFRQGEVLDSDAWFADGIWVHKLARTVNWDSLFYYQSPVSNFEGRWLLIYIARIA